jgi:hypothetical protein
MDPAPDLTAVLTRRHGTKHFGQSAIRFQLQTTAPGDRTPGRYFQAAPKQALDNNDFLPIHDQCQI